MPYGSRAEYAEPRDELKQMKRKTRESGRFPKVGRSSVETMQKQIEAINKGKDSTQFSSDELHWTTG